MRLRHRRAHRVTWVVLALLLPAILLAGFVLRQPPAEEAPRRLSAPPA